MNVRHVRPYHSAVADIQEKLRSSVVLHGLSIRVVPHYGVELAADVAARELLHERHGTDAIASNYQYVKATPWLLHSHRACTTTYVANTQPSLLQHSLSRRLQKSSRAPPNPSAQ